MESTVSVVGLGKLGAPLAACLASRGLRVIAVDADRRKVAAINQGKSPVFEPGLAELLQASEGRLSATANIEGAVAVSEITFIVVATPSEPDGGFALCDVLAVCEAIGCALKPKRAFHLVVLTSTVMPGSTAGAVWSGLEKASGKRVSRDFGLCYSPEFVALGSVVHDFLNPEFVLIGESDARSGEMLETLYKTVCENMPSVARMNFINAEITKLALNTYLTTKISYANMLARICEKFPTADVDVVTGALGLDSRIGPKYLKGGIGYGGPCFPRDNLALAALAQQVGAPADIAKTTHRFNRSQVEWLAGLVQQELPESGRAGILGLTYKPNTDVVEEAFGVLLAQELASRGLAVVVYDPTHGGALVPALAGKARLATTAEDCIAQSDVVVLTTPWPEFAGIPLSQWARHSWPRTVIDCWRMLKDLASADGIRYIGLGTGTTAERFATQMAASTGSLRSGC